MTEEEVEEILESDNTTVLTQDLSVSSQTTCSSMCMVITFYGGGRRVHDQGQNLNVLWERQICIYLLSKSSSIFVLYISKCVVGI